MKVLALDSSTTVASVAIVEEQNLIGEYTINHKKTHSQTLLSMLDEVVQMTECDLAEIDVIAVSAGPGSFTGLRIGSATAKGLGLALDKPIASVPTIDALAYNMWGCEELICPMMDARRQQVYTGLYRFEDGAFKVIEEQNLILLPDLLAKLNEIGQPVVFLGDAVDGCMEMLAKDLTIPYRLAPASLNRQRASSVALLGMKMAQEGRLDTATSHKPDYLRDSQAERERKEKERDFRIC